MVMTQFNIPISMLRQYCFCPRIPFYYLVRQLKPVAPMWVSQGIDEHERQEMLLKRRNLSGYGIDSTDWSIRFNVELYSEKIGVHGICDSVLEADHSFHVLEFKNSQSVEFNHGAKLQLAAYSMLCEEKYGTIIQNSFLLYGSKAKTYELRIDQELRSRVINAIEKIQEMLLKGTLPMSSAEESKCCQCEFFNFCADRY